MAADRPPPRRTITPAGLMVVGSEMVGFTIIGLLIDFGLGTLPWFTVGLTLLGFVVVFYHLVRFARAISRQSGVSGEERR